MRQRLIVILIGLLGVGSVITLMWLSALHVEAMWLKWILRGVALAAFTTMETMILIYWAQTPSRRPSLPDGRRDG